MAVVDPETMGVHGLEGLKVADLIFSSLVAPSGRRCECYALNC